MKNSIDNKYVQAALFFIIEKLQQDENTSLKRRIRLAVSQTEDSILERCGIPKQRLLSVIEHSDESALENTVNSLIDLKKRSAELNERKGGIKFIRSEESHM